MKEIRTKIDIEAPLTEVWSLFSNFEKYGDWNPFLLEVKGSLIEGRVIKIKARFNDGSLRDAEPKVDKVVLGESACFVAKKGILFTGRHYFIFEELSGTSTRFIHGETFYGLLPLLFWHKMERSLTASFIGMNKALKREAEKIHNQRQ